MRIGNNVSDVSRLVDGDKNSPFRSISFVVASVVGLGSVVFDIYLIYRHWHTAPTYVLVILSTPIGAQLIYQWLRVVRDCAKLQQLRSKGVVEETRDGSSGVDVAAEVAVRGMVDLLFLRTVSPFLQ